MTDATAPTTAPSTAAAVSLADRAAQPPVRRVGRPVKLAVFYLVLLAIAAIFLAPYVFALFASFKPLSGIQTDRPWQPPTRLDVDNFVSVLRDQHFLTYLRNTLMVTVILTLGQVAFSLLGAYAFARLRFPGRDALFYAYLGTMMVPGAVTLIPTYVIMDRLRLLDTYWALFLPYVLGTPYTIFLMRQYLLTLPEELFEAARLDGCSELRVLWQVVVPIARPILVTAALIAFVFGWNNFLWPLIATNSTSLRVNTVGVATLQSNYGTEWNLVLAGSLLALAPMVALFAIFQRQIVRSIQLGGVNR